MSETSTRSAQPELPSIAEYWQQRSGSYDEEVDHGLRDATAREAWRAHLTAWLPAHPGHVLDLGCGTGSLSRLALEAGHRVTGVDLAPGMVALAEAKCAGLGESWFLVGDAAQPPVGDERFDAVLARHLLWTLPDPHAVLARWVSLVRPGGRLVLVEGRWWTSDAPVTPYAAGTDTLPWQGGVRAEDLVAALDPLVARLEMVCLSDEAALWGREVEDERYAVVATIR